MEDKKIKILLAEDDKFISLAYKDGLSRSGFEVVHAMTGTEAVALARKSKPDIILLDIIMPEMNGFEVLEELNKDVDLKKIPVVILSNLGQDSDIERSRELGADDYLIKSNVAMSEVVEKVNQIIKNKKS